MGRDSRMGIGGDEMQSVSSDEMQSVSDEMQSVSSIHHIHAYQCVCVCVCVCIICICMCECDEASRAPPHLPSRGSPLSLLPSSTPPLLCFPCALGCRLQECRV